MSTVTVLALYYFIAASLAAVASAISRPECILALPINADPSAPTCRLISNSQRMNLTSKIDNHLREIVMNMERIETVAGCHEEYRALNQVSMISWLLS